MKRKTAFFGFALILFPGWLAGQEYRGTISGDISDAQGAPVAKAKVVITETRTGAPSETVSEASGAFTVPFLLPGQYEIAIEAKGFKKAVRRGVTLSAGDHQVIDIHLDVGDVNQSVTVTAEAPLIESANGTIGQVITTSEVEDFPLNGRTPMVLANLALGVIATAEPGPSTPSDLGGPSNLSIAGSPSGTSESMLNGAPNIAYLGYPAYEPPQDAVRELRVNSFDTDASAGHSLGGTTNQITKSGTNQFRGSIYDFNQSAKFNANSFFNNKNGIADAPYRQNQEGLTAGGPVWIPKVFNGKNRVFWFIALERFINSTPQNCAGCTSNPVYFATVPTPAERQGDFSALLKLGTNYTIYDPSTGVASGSQVQRTAFPNNVIPTSRLNPVALAYLKYYPQPNTPGRVDGFQNYIVNGNDLVSFDNQLGRLDLNLSDRNKLYYDFRHTLRDSFGNQFLGTGNVASGQAGTNRMNWGSTLDDVYILSPTLVADVRLNWTRFAQWAGSVSDGFDPTQLGFPSYIAQDSQYPRMPYITFGSATPAGGSVASFQYLGASIARTYNVGDVFQIFGDIVKVRGNHTLKIGADIREDRWSSFGPGNSAGTYNFTSAWTNGPLSNAAASPLGQDFAAFLLGLPVSGSYDENSQSTLGNKYYALFVQEDWRIRSNLTVNVGLRWEHESPATERHNRAEAGFDPKAVNSASAAAASAYATNPIPQIPVGQFSALGGLTFASAANPNIYHTTSGMFSPRTGFAWTPKKLGSKTVIRGGFGVFVAPIGLLGSSSMGLNYRVSGSSLATLRQSGFSQTTQFVSTSNNYLSPSGTLSNPFPNGILQPAGSSLGASTFLGQQIIFFNPNILNPYALRWNLNVERQLPGQIVLEVAYIGNHAVHLLVGSTNLNSIPSQYLSTSPVRDATAINLLSGTVTNPMKGLLPNSTNLNGLTVARSQLLLPYPQFPANGVLEDCTNAGSSFYESLEVRLQKRFTHGITLISNFAWNRYTERDVYLNDTDPVPEKRPAQDSRPLREVLAGTYQLPVGAGKHFDLQSRLWNRVLGDWAVNGIMILQAGPLLAWGNVIYYGGPIDLNPHQPNGVAFDTSRFNTISAQQLSDNIRTFDTFFNNLRRDPTRNLDVSLLKQVPFGEHRYVQLRFEAYNVTNRVTFNAPNLTPTSTAFGTITGQANTARQLQLAFRVVW